MVDDEKQTEKSANAGSDRDDELANAVDSVEDRIVEERTAEDRAGNAADRAETEQVESDDQAPA